MWAERTRRAVALVLLALSIWPASVRAQDASPEDPKDDAPHPFVSGSTLELENEPEPEFRSSRKLVWRWRRFSTEEYYVTGVAALTVVGTLLISPNKTRWQGGVLFDEDVRDGVALDSYQDRRAARDISDVLIAGLIAYPVLVDGVIVTSGYYRADDVMEQMLLIDAEVLAITAAVQSVVAGVSSRERPYGRVCGSEELAEDTRDCERRSRYRSFFSGHSSTAFAAAGLACSHHMNLELYGGGAPDAAACGVSLFAAAATASLRVIGDVHYTSDVTVGALWGSLAGFGLPYLLHYGSPTRSRERRSAVQVHLMPVGAGAGVGGSF